MKKPMLFPLIYLILGIFARYKFNWDIYMISLFSVVIFLSITIIHLKFSTKKVYFLIIVYIFGFFMTNLSLNNPKNFENKKVDIVGIIDYKKRTSSGYDKLYVKTLKINGQNEKKKIYCIYSGGESLNISDKIEFRAMLNSLEENKNTGEYNEFLYEKSQNVSYKTFTSNIKILDTSKNLKFYLSAFRNKISKNYEKILPKDQANTVKAIILGDKDDFNDEIANLYKIGGIYHILAISGLHIGILAGFLYFVFKKIFKNRWANSITILVLILYTILTGASISTVRATIMCSIFLSGPFFHRKRDGMNSLFVAGFILLIYQPLYLFRAGFQLSFLAVFGIMVLNPPIEKFFNNILLKKDNVNFIYIKKIVSPYVFPIISAFFATTCIIAYYFYYIYPYTIFANILIGFTIPFLIILSFIVGIVSLISISVAGFLAVTIYYILSYYEGICMFFSKMPFNSILVGSPSLLFIFATFLLYFIFIIFIETGKKAYKYATLILLISMISFTYFDKNMRNMLYVSLLNNGSDTIVFIEKNKAYLMDNNTNNISTATNIINYHGISKFDGVFIFTMDEKHTKNTINLLENQKVDNIYIKKVDYSNNSCYDSILKIAKSNNIDIIEMKEGELVEFGKIKSSFDQNNFLVKYNDFKFCYVSKIPENADITVFDGEEYDFSQNKSTVFIGRNIEKLDFPVETKNYKKENSNIYLKIADNIKVIK